MIIKDIDEFIIKNKIERIFLDWDGVLTHSVEAIVNILNEKNDTNFSPQDVISWNFKEIDPFLTDKEMEDLFVTDEFYLLVKFIKNAIKFLEKYKDKIVIVTKAQYQNYKIKFRLLDWCNLKDIPIIPIPLNMSKRIIDMSMERSLFIDDSTKNLEETNALYKIQFLEYNDDKNELREWTKGWNGDKMYHW